MMGALVDPLRWGPVCHGTLAGHEQAATVPSVTLPGKGLAGIPHGKSPDVLPGPRHHDLLPRLEEEVPLLSGFLTPEDSPRNVEALDESSSGGRELEDDGLGSGLHDEDPFSKNH